MTRGRTRYTQAWTGRNGKVVTYREGEDKPDLPEPTNTSGMQRRNFTGQKNIITPSSPGWGAKATPRKRRRKSKPGGVMYRTETRRDT